MESFLIDSLNLLARWLHVVAGVAWIGSSFYFVWLDDHLEPPKRASDRERGVAGELWSVHGGGFYHAQKYRVAPPTLPETLHWFKWEAYTTWLSGMFLLAVIYGYGAEIYLIDASVAALSAPAAVAISIASIAGGWVVYDALCRSSLVDRQLLFAGILLLLTTGLAFGLCQVFSGRGAYIHFGAVLGSIMVANVFFVIIPGQRKLVEAAARGTEPDPLPGIRAKQRSVHNTYFTLPVLFTMTSNHFAMTYSHRYNWAILVAISLAGALIRVYFVARHRGPASPIPILAAASLLIAVLGAIAPRGETEVTGRVELKDVRAILQARCVTCHAETPTFPGFHAPPAGVLLETEQQILAGAQRIHRQAVVLRVMPIGNLTGMTEEERVLLGRWYVTSERGERP